MRPAQVVVRKALRRAQVLPFFAKLPPCLVGMEACGTSHHWARELIKLGHEVRLMPPAYVKPYVKRGKTDAADAEAICEAVTRPTMRFVPVKSPEQQAALSLHRTRDLLVKQRTQLVNMIRGLLAEFGIDIPKGLERALADGARRSSTARAPEVPMEAARIVASSVAAGARHPCPAPRDRSRSGRGIAPTMSHGVSRRSPASGRSARRHLPHRSPIRISSARAGSSPPGWG